ncbi:MAG: GIY-YIG nuclease family protein, partial [Ignavibacterium sp.]|nr:GIY-YIG nuclease family protein [Ignavibacterium sp.]
MNAKLELQLKNLPSLPGVYQFLNKNGKIIYVGKAKNLKNRVRSYFQNNIT